MKRLIAVMLLGVFARSALAADPVEPSPIVRPIPGIGESIQTRELMDSPSAGAASLPDLGSTHAANKFADTERLPLPGGLGPLFGERPRYLGRRPYWENDPLFSAPLQ
jgi:hypothetical protein